MKKLLSVSIVCAFACSPVYLIYRCTKEKNAEIERINSTRVAEQLRADSIHDAEKKRIDKFLAEAGDCTQVHDAYIRHLNSVYNVSAKIEDGVLYIFYDGVNDDKNVSANIFIDDAIEHGCKIYRAQFNDPNSGKLLSVAFRLPE